MKKLLSIVVAVVVLLLLAVMIVPMFVNANQFRPALETQLTSALGRKVTLGNLRFSLFSASLVAHNISIAGDPAFSAAPLLQAPSLRIRFQVGPLLFHRQLLVKGFVADSPSINLLHNAQGLWNFSAIGNTAGSRTRNTQHERARPNFTVGQVKIVNGTVTVSDVSAMGQPFTSMLAGITGQITWNGQSAASNGTVHAVRLQLVANGAPAPNPVDITYTIHHNLQAGTGQINDLGIKAGDVAVHVTGTYSMVDPHAMLDLRLAAPKLPINQVEALLPAVGVRLSSGSSLQGGTLTADLSIIGPADGPVISGPVEVDNTRLAGFDLSSKLGLKPVSGTQIQTLKANVASSPRGTSIDNLYASIPVVGTATGAGTVSPGGVLNFQLVAKLNPSSGRHAGFLAQAVSAVAANGIPVHITGTMTNPVIQADLSQLLGHGDNKAGDVLKKLLHR